MKNTSLWLVAVLILCVIGMVALFPLETLSANIGTETTSPEALSLATSDVLRWHTLSDMHKGRGDPGVAVVNDKIYVISGFWSPGYNYVWNQEVYDPLTSNWTELGAVPVQRSDFVALEYGGLIYTIGGWNVSDYSGSLDFNHVYNPATDTWDQTKQPLPTAVSGAAGVVLNDKFYTLGGYNSDYSTSLSIVQIYDPTSDSWTTGTPMNSIRSEFGAVVINGKIYAVGGQDISDPVDMEIFDPSTNTWSPGPLLPESRSSMGVAIWQGKIVVIGGQIINTSEAFDTMYLFDPNTSTWSTGDPMPTARWACRAVVINDKIYVVGGAGESGAGYATEAFGLFPPNIYLPLISHK
jgi:hypothetical protein